MASDDVLLDVQGLVKHYPVRGGGLIRRKVGTVKAVDGVDLAVRRGETVGLVGESGCGKSTLARLILALERPTAGRVLLNGTDVFALGKRELRALRRDIQIVLQDPYTAFNPKMTAGEIIGEPLAINKVGNGRGERTQRVRELLDVVGLNPDHMNRYPHQFSGGQRQRIGIARALALRPKIVICDEPVSALDVSVQAQVINLLKDLQSEFGLAYLFIAHDLSVVRHVSDRVSVMYLGKIVERGTEQEIYDHPRHPYTVALHSAAPDPEATAAGRRSRIVLVGEVPSPVNPPSGCSFHTRCWLAQPVCSTDVPELRPRTGSEHPSACHFAHEVATSAESARSTGRTAAPPEQRATRGLDDTQGAPDAGGDVRGSRSAST